MGIKVKKSALPTLFNFARVRAAHQPHVNDALLTLENIFLLDFKMRFLKNVTAPYLFFLNDIFHFYFLFLKEKLESEGCS